MLLLFISTQAAPAQPGFINTGIAVSEIWPPLNASGPGDAVFWTEDELYSWIDEAVKRIARKVRSFIVYDTSLATSIGAGTYNLPATHIVTLQVDVAGEVLRPRNIQEMEALSSSWPIDSGTPAAFLEDTQGFNQITLDKKPTVGAQAIGIVMAELPPDISIAAAILAAPPVLRDYFTLYALTEARARESNASMDEIVDWLRQLTGTYEKAMMALWTSD